MRLGQGMRLAPRMIQSMEVLQMSTQALEERIEQELASNPTLELAEARVDAEGLRRDREDAIRDATEGEREMRVTERGDSAGGDDFERLSNLSEEYGESWSANTYDSGETYSSRKVASGTGERDAKMDAMANTAARSASLYEQLMDQWRMVEASPAEYEAGEYLISRIDADGYLRTPWVELLEDRPEGMGEGDMQAALAMLQRTLEPPGMGARDLRECLLLQIDAAERADASLDLEPQRTLVSEYLDDIEKNRLPAIAKATGWDIEEVKSALAGLRQFQPHPGRALARDEAPGIIPDVTVEYDEENNTYSVTLTSGRLPTLEISSSYKKMLKQHKIDKEVKEFVQRNVRSAHWLIDAIEQRGATLLRVVSVVVEAQREFFEQGPSALKPLPMTQVADQLGIHVSTVSRAADGKYLQTPRGVYPLRMFFSGGTETDEGEAMSWTAVQARLREIVDAEDKSSPLADDALVEKLKEAGIEIARRTVAKYRKELNIPTARQRREY